MSGGPHVELRRWQADDLPVLIRSNTPEMTQFVGGPEPDESVTRRHELYLKEWDEGRAGMFTVRLGEDAVGSIGFWPIEWNDRPVYEAGWSTLPEWQGRGIATAALALLLDYTRERGDRDELHAFPLVEHLASNRLCKRAGFAFEGLVSYPGRQGGLVTCCDWAISLRRP